MHIVKELIDNISSTSLNRFLTEQKIANEQRLSFSDQRVLLEQLCQSGLISVEDLNDFFFQELLYGHHRLMRVYSLTASTCLRLKSRDSWGRLMRKFQIPDWTYNQIYRDDPTEGRLHEACSDTGRKKEWKFNQGASDFCILHVKRFCWSD